MVNLDRFFVALGRLLGSDKWILDTGYLIKYGMKGYGIISVEAFSDFNPLFAYVFVDGKNINLDLVRQGLNRQKDRQKNRFHLTLY